LYNHFPWNHVNLFVLQLKYKHRIPGNVFKRFIPAYRDGVDPYGKWAWSWVITTAEWANSKGAVPNATDFAILEVQDQTISGATRKIGDVTGYFGYRTQSLLPNHATMLGYPCNLDSCQKMHQVTAESFQANGNNTVIYGSDMGGGSSGGPWVQNFGTPAIGQTAGLNTGTNQIIGVTSCVPIDEKGPLYAGSSILNNSFLDILNKACARKAGNC
jgi:V8-like Glu-specific endopeptidase